MIFNKHLPKAGWWAGCSHGNQPFLLSVKRDQAGNIYITNAITISHHECFIANKISDLLHAATGIGFNSSVEKMDGPILPVSFMSNDLSTFEIYGQAAGVIMVI